MVYRWWLGLERYVLFSAIRLFRIRGHSERGARGFALGLLVNFFPTFGFGVVISVALARLLGGNGFAGLVGGASLTFAWPVLFYFNLKTGSLLLDAPLAVDDLEEVNEKTMLAMMWGQNFMVGAVVNAVLAGLVVYLLWRLAYHEIRPGALAYFRHHARDHQRRFRRPR